MAPPFSTEAFFGVFVDYNQAVWPAQLLLVALAVALVVSAWRGPWRGSSIALSLAVLWAWMGAVYFWAYFARINPAARVFGALFLAEAALFAWYGLGARRLSFHPRADLRGIAGWVLVAYAVVLYPLLAIAAGHHFPAQPTFGLPCPTTIFTVGLLLWTTRRVPRALLIVPVLWSVVGLSAVRFFGVWEDAFLPVAVLGGGALIVWGAAPRGAAPAAG